MGDMTLAESIVEVRQDLDGRSIIALPDARIERWLKWTLDHVANPKVYMHPRLYITENVTLVTATSQYVLGTNDREIWLVIGVKNTQALTGYPLYPKNRKWFRRRIQDAPGRPSYYMHTSTAAALNVLQLYNAPDATHNGQVLEVEEYVKHVDWETAEYTVLDAMWDEVVVMGAIWRGWRSLNQPVFADRALADYASLINEIRERDGLEAIEDPRAFDLDVGGHGSPRYTQYGRGR